MFHSDPTMTSAQHVPATLRVLHNVPQDTRVTHATSCLTNKVCEVAIAAAKECKQKLQSMSGADTADTIWYVLLGVPRNLVSVDGEHGVDLAAIYERLSESGLGSCLLRTMIECFPAQEPSTPSRRGCRLWRSQSRTSSAQWRRN